jgi:hypothetical protein
MIDAHCVILSAKREGTLCCRGRPLRDAKGSFASLRMTLLV